MGKKLIYFIYADGCKDCIRMRLCLESTLGEHFEESVVSLNSKTSEAVDIAIEKGIGDIPACEIDGKVIEGKNFSSVDLTKELTSWKSRLNKK